MGTFAIPRQMDIIPPGSKMAPKARTIIQYAERGKPYAAPLVHTQGADTITETTGENTEQVQRRQDSDIEAIKEQLNTGFTGTTVTHTLPRPRRRPE